MATANQSTKEIIFDWLVRNSTRSDFLFEI